MTEPAETYPQKAARIAERFRSAEGVGSRRDVMQSLAGSPDFSLGTIESLLVQHTQMLEALESCRNLLLGVLDFDRDSRMVFMLDRTIAAAKGEDL